MNRCSIIAIAVALLTFIVLGAGQVQGAFYVEDTFAFGANPNDNFDLVIDPSIDRLFAGQYAPGAQIYAIDTASNLVVDSRTIGGSAVAGMDVNTTTHKFYYSDQYQGVHVLDGTNLAAPVTTVSVGGYETGVAANSSTNKYGVTLQGFGGNDPLQIFDGNTNVPLLPGSGTGSGGVAGSVTLNEATGYYYVMTSNGVRVIDESGATITHLAPAGYRVESADSVRNRVYLHTGNTLEARDGTLHGLLDSITFPDMINHTDVDTATGDVFVSFGTAGKVGRLDSNLTGLEMLNLGGNQTYLAVDATTGRAYVYDRASGMVNVLVPEPSSIVLLAMGALGIVAFGWRRRRHKTS